MASRASGDGLTDADKKVLNDRLTALQQLYTRRHLFGGNDQMKIYDAIKRLQSRLSPEIPARLIAVADDVLCTYVLSRSEAPAWMDQAVVESLRETLG